MTTQRSWLVPAPADVIFIVVAFTAAFAFGHQAINTDGDLARHLRVGREILTHGLFFTDQFSWTMYGQSFVPYEWGSEVFYALAHRVAGLPGVVALMAIAIGAGYFCLNLLLQRLGMDPLLAFGASAAAAVLGSIHWLARPHVFSLVFVVGVVWLLEGGQGGQDGQGGQHERASLRGGSGGPDEAIESSGYPITSGASRPRNDAALALVLFAVWANLHAGFLYGLVLIGFYLAGDLIALVLERHRADHRAAFRRHAWLFVAALAGSCLNPRGPLTILHVAGYLQLDFLLDMTAEMRSPDFHRWYGREFLIALLLVLAALALVRRRMRWPRLVVLLGTTAFALQAVRNVPLWALTGFSLAMLHANEAWRGIGWAPAARLRGAFASGASLARAGLWSLLPALGLVALALAGGRVSGIQFLPDRFDPTVFPVKLVERARAAGVTGKMFNEFIWGGYILYTWPEQRVFMDGQTDFYGVPLSRLYVSLHEAEPGWERRLDSLGVTIVLLPQDVPLARALLKEPGWSVSDSADGGVRFRASAPSLVR